MSNSEKLLKIISSLIENGILTSKDIKNEISTDLKFKKDKKRIWGFKTISSKARYCNKKNFKK